jgi:hypothetical protein
MREHWKALAVASAMTASAIAATTLYAGSRHDASGTTMGRGGMMGQGGMMGRMGQMGGMMDHCSQMMGGFGSGRPNEQWKKEPPKQPEKPEKKG